MKIPTLFSRLATASFALLGLSLLSKPALAYEEDTHFTMTFVQCRAAGFTDAEALTVATYDQGMDDSAGTVANDGAIPHVAEEHLWHSIPQNGTAAEVLARKNALWSQATSETDPQNQLKRLGVFFHYQQDTWAHRHHPNSAATGFDPYQVPIGHAIHGHQPDRPPFDPVCALRCLEDGIGYAKSFVSTVLRRSVNPLFNNYQPARGAVDAGWGDSRKGLLFNQLAADNSTPARAFVTGLIRAQVNAYSSSFDANPSWFGRSTADEAKYATVRANLTPICLTQAIVIPSSRTKLTSLTTAQLQGGNLGTRNYTVRVYTGNVSGAGTDANIFLSMQGATGSTSVVKLNPMISGNAFERNQTDTIVLNGYPNVGELTGITIRSDDAWPGSAWYLGWVEISAPGMATRRFTLNDWIEKGKLTRTLH